MFRLKTMAFILFFGVLLSSCGPATQVEPGIPSTGTPQPSSTVTASPMPTLTLIPTITPTPAPPNPLSVEYLRQRTYSGELTIEETLTPEESYNRFIVSYLSDGNKNYALLTVPNGEMPETGWPVIVFNHGYIPPAEYSSTQGYAAYVNAFASNGYIVLRPDYRGHGNSEGEPVNTYFDQGNTIDVLNAVAAVKHWETADPDRIGMWGHSMGGWITLRALVVDPDIRAAVIWSGALGSYADLCAYWFNCDNWDDATWAFWMDTPFATFGLPSENAEFWASVSADSYLPEIKGAVQLHHATTDTVVPVALSQIMFEKMADAGVDVEYFEYPGDDHNISQTFDLAMERSLNFFDLHLKGIEN